MKAISPALAVLLLCSGCTATSLQHYALNQALSVSDMRYRQVLNDLAIVAHNSGSLPAFAVTAGGVANVTNTVSIDTATLWDQAVRGFSKETLTAFAQHNPELQWTLDPLVSSPQLEALHFACLWVLIGPPPPGSRAMELLREPIYEDVIACNKTNPIYHFDVANQLAKLPRGWLHVDSNHSVPKGMTWKATCGNTTVWVAPQDFAWLSEFTLAILDIATVDPTSLVIPYPKASVTITEKTPDDQPTGDIANPPAPKGGTTTKKPVEEDPTASPQPLPPQTAASPPAILQGGKITEIWDVCQDCSPDKIGKITITRPRSLRYPSANVPTIGVGDNATPTPPTLPLVPLDLPLQSSPASAPLR